MSKDPLNFDFSELTTKATKQLPTQKVEEPKVENPPAKPNTIQLLGINVALDTAEPGKVILKDLAELTGEEFLTWAARVFPVLNSNNANPRDFDTRTAKARAFEQILHFHANPGIFHAKKDSKEIKLN